MGRILNYVRDTADVLTQAVSQHFWDDRSVRRIVLMSTLESQSEDVNSEVLEVDLTNRHSHKQ